MLLEGAEGALSDVDATDHFLFLSSALAGVSVTGVFDEQILRLSRPSHIGHSPSPGDSNPALGRLRTGPEQPQEGPREPQIRFTSRSRCAMNIGPPRGGAVW